MSDVVFSALITVVGMVIVALFTSYSQRRTTEFVIKNENKNTQENFRKNELIRLAAEYAMEIDPETERQADFGKLALIYTQLLMFLDENIVEEKAVLQAMTESDVVLRGNENKTLPGMISYDKSEILAAQSKFILAVRKAVRCRSC